MSHQIIFVSEPGKELELKVNTPNKSFLFEGVCVNESVVSAFSVFVTRVFIAHYVFSVQSLEYI